MGLLDSLDIFELLGFGDATGLEMIFAASALVGGILFLIWFALMMIGGVTPIGLPDTLPVFIDSDVMTIDYVIIGGGSRSGKIQMNPQELLKLPNSKVVQGLSKT